MHILQGRPTRFSTFKNAVLQVEASTLYQKIKGAKTQMASDDIRRAVFPTARALRDIIHPDTAVEDRARARAVVALEDYKKKVLWSLDLQVKVKEMKLGKLLHPSLVVLLCR